MKHNFDFEEYIPMILRRHATWGIIAMYGLKLLLG